MSKNKRDIKTILITGASSGFGLMVTLILLKKGHTVIAGVRGGEGRFISLFEKTSREGLMLSEAMAGGRLYVLDIHMEDPSSFSLAKTILMEKFQFKLDVLINNAGYGIIHPIEIQTPEQIRHQFEVNYFGPIQLIKTLLDELRNAKGRIINVSSVVGLCSLPFYGTYAATKHALEASSEALSYELKPFDVDVTLVEPGSFRTEFISSFLDKSQELEPTYAHLSDFYGKRITNLNTFIQEKSRFAGRPKRVAKLIVRLCFKKKVKIRYLIGMDACFMAFLKLILPENTRHKFMDFIFRKFAFKE